MLLGVTIGPLEYISQSESKLIVLFGVVSAVLKRLQPLYTNKKIVCYVILGSETLNPP